MAELKTKQTESSVEAFLAAISDETRRQDCLTISKMMKKATKAEPKMWGTSIVGFGNRHYKYASGREGDWFVIGFSPRKQDLTLYLAGGFSPNSALMQKLGKHKTGGTCLYIKRLADVDLGVLEELVRQSVKEMGKYKAQAHPTQPAKK
jgi:hypothetical protein